jgi:hypothetical protein
MPARGREDLEGPGQVAGRLWRNIQVEISPDEGGAASEYDIPPAPDLKHFGIPTPDQLFGIALRATVSAPRLPPHPRGVLTQTLTPPDRVTCDGGERSHPSGR